MNPSTLVRHVRRYPRWYAALAVWLVFLLLAPVVGVDVLPAFGAPAAQQQPVATTPSTVGPTAPLPDLAAGPVDAAPAPLPDATPVPVDEGEPTPSPDPEFVPPEELPPGLFDPLFDAIPGLPAIDTPPELMPLFRAVAPIAGYGCTATGLASLVLAVVAPSVEDVPLERILPYLAPVTSACANFPIPETHTVCALDQPFVVDLGGLATSPPVIGVGIDVIEAFETELINAFGIEVPRLSASLREQLDCEVVTG